MQVNALVAFTPRHKILFYIDFPRFIDGCREGFADDADTVFRNQRECPAALCCMQFAKRAGKQARIIFRFASHVPHHF